jgi:predicted short-subunit dehydrogenase-like oxidoreductase (DUF2520 family)
LHVIGRNPPRCSSDLLPVLSPREAALASLPGSYCFDEGEEAALAALENLGAAIGAHGMRIDTQHKALYQAAAVMACN